MVSPTHIGGVVTDLLIDQDGMHADKGAFTAVAKAKISSTKVAGFRDQDEMGTTKVNHIRSTRSPFGELPLNAAPFKISWYWHIHLGM